MANQPGRIPGLWWGALAVAAAAMAGDAAPVLMQAAAIVQEARA